MELITVTNSTVSISSRDIAELTNKEHKNVKRDIENSLFEDALKFEHIYFDTMNRKQTEYLLPKNIALGIVSGYSFELRMKIINRLEQLELQTKSQFKLPQTYSEALRALADESEAKEKALALLEEQKPKVEFYEAVTGSKDTIDMGQVAKVLNKNIGRTKLFAFLRDNGVLMSNNIPYQKYCDNGYFRVIESKYTKPDGSTHIGLKTVVYQKGVNYINKLLGA